MCLQTILPLLPRWCRTPWKPANVDQYTKNVTGELVNGAVGRFRIELGGHFAHSGRSLGTEGANGTNSAANLQAIAQQVQGILPAWCRRPTLPIRAPICLAEPQRTTTPYTADSSSPSGYTYNGNNDTNSVAIGDNLNVQVNLPGSQIFSNSSHNVLGP